MKRSGEVGNFEGNGALQIPRPRSFVIPPGFWTYEDRGPCLLTDNVSAPFDRVSLEMQSKQNAQALGAGR